MKKLFFFLFIMAGWLFPQPFSLFSNDNFHNTTFSYSNIDLYREESIKHFFSLDGYMLSGKYYYEWGKNSINISIGRMDLKLVSENSTSDLDIKIKKINDYFSLDFSRGEGFVELSGDARLIKNEKRFYFNYGFNFNLNFLRSKQLTTGFGISRSEYPLNFEADYLEEKFNITGGFRNKSMLAKLNFSPDRKSRIDIEYRRFMPLESISKEDFHMNESPKFEVWLSSFASEHKDFLLKGDFFLFGGDYYADFFNGNQTFGYLKIPEIKGNGLKLNLSSSLKEQSQTDFSFLYLFLKGNAVGNIQSWPFLSIVQSVIANRLNYRFSFSGKVLGFRLKHIKKWNHFTFIPTLFYFDIQPNFSLQTWQPAYLAIGVKEFYSNELKFSRAGVILFSVRGNYKLGEFIISADFNQFIPLYVKSREFPSKPPVPGEPEEKVAITSSGGRWFSIGIFKGF